MYQATSKGIKLLSEFYNFPLKDNLPIKYKKYEKVSVEHMDTNVCSEEKRIKQVLMNLQSNALKFTKEGGYVKIICEFIAKTSSKSRNVNTDFRNDNDYYDSSNDSDDSKGSKGSNNDSKDKGNKKK